MYLTNLPHGVLWEGHIDHIWSRAGSPPAYGGEEGASSDPFWFVSQGPTTHANTDKVLNDSTGETEDEVQQPNSPTPVSPNQSPKTTTTVSRSPYPSKVCTALNNY